MSDSKIHQSGVELISAAKMLLRNEKNEVLILTIGEYEAHPEKSHTPDFPGGIVESGNGETELAGVLRETKEETGIEVSVENVFLAFAGTNYYAEKNESVSKFLYIAHLDHTPKVTLSWEHESYEWVPIKDLLATKTLRPFYKEAIEYSIEHKLI